MSNTASYIGKEPQYGVFITQTETGDGSTVAFTLDYTAATTASLLVSVGGVVQQPAVAYNLNPAGTTLTFTGAPGSAEAIWILYLGQLYRLNLHQYGLFAPSAVIFLNLKHQALNLQFDQK